MRNNGIRRSNTITNSINNYYNFYIDNGYFPTDSKRSTPEERHISKAYTRALNEESRKYYMSDHRDMIKKINDIKKKKENDAKLKIIEEYVSFYENHDNRRARRRDGASNYDENIDGEETKLALKMSRLKLDEVDIPEDLKKRLDNLDKPKDEDIRIIRKKVNGYMKLIIDFMEKYNGTPYERRLRNIKISYDGYELTIESALKYVDKYINLVDDELLEKYNSFSFIKTPKYKDKCYDLSKYLYYTFNSDQYLQIMKCIFESQFLSTNGNKRNGIISLAFSPDNIFMSEVYSDGGDLSMYEECVLNKNGIPSLILDSKLMDDIVFVPPQGLYRPMNHEIQIKEDLSLEYLIGIGLYEANSNQINMIYKALENHNLDIPLINLDNGYAYRKR